MRSLLLWLFGLRVLRLEKGDVLVLHCGVKLSEDSRARLVNEMKRLTARVGADVPCLVLDEGMDLSVIGFGALVQ